jgi:hypothetical protein
MELVNLQRREMKIKKIKIDTSEIYKGSKEDQGRLKIELEELKLKNRIFCDTMFTVELFRTALFLPDEIGKKTFTLDEATALLSNLKPFPETPFRNIDVKYNLEKGKCLIFCYQTDEETGRGLIRFLTDEELYYYAKT